MPKFVHDGQQLHLVSAVMVTSRGCRHFLMTSSRWVLNPLPEKGAKKQQILQRKAHGIQTGKSPEEKERPSPMVVPVPREKENIRSELYTI